MTAGRDADLGGMLDAFECLKTERVLPCCACGGKGGQFLPPTTVSAERWAPCLACGGSGQGAKIVTYLPNETTR